MMTVLAIMIDGAGDDDDGVGYGSESGNDRFFFPYEVVKDDKDMRMYNL